MKNVTALVKTFLRDENLYLCVSSLKTHYPDINIIVADDGYTSDEKENKLLSMGVSLYHRMPFNSGLPKGRNALVDLCKTDFALIGDDDFVYDESSNLESMLCLMPIADIAGGAVFQDREVQHYEGDFVWTDDGGIVTNEPDRTIQFFKGVRFYPADIVFNFFIAHTAALRKARWNENIKINFEHTDYFLEAHKQGLGVVYTPDCVVVNRPPNVAEPAEYYEKRKNSTDRPAFFAKWDCKYLINVRGSRYEP